MDASRRTVQAPAELPVPRPFLLSSHSSARADFRCYLCHGSAYTVDRRPAPSGLKFLSFLEQLAGYEQYLRLSATEDVCEVFVCPGCADTAAKALAAAREAIVGRLLWAARELAEMQFTRATRYGCQQIICVQCRQAQVSSNYSNHNQGCRVGRVLSLIDAMRELGRRRDAYREFAPPQPGRDIQKGFDQLSEELDMPRATSCAAVTAEMGGAR